MIKREFCRRSVLKGKDSEFILGRVECEGSLGSRRRSMPVSVERVGGVF